MSFNLWKPFLEDDVDAFRQYLARATYTHASTKVATASPANPSLKIGSPSTLATSPRTPTKPRRILSSTPQSAAGRIVVLTRADINARDGFGRTILHHAASSHNENATEFVKALLEIPLLDLYIQDIENGWTALHRALYAGNIDIAQAILARDIHNATDYSNQSRTQIGGLVKIKDHEGNSPFEVFSSTIAPRILQDAIGDDDDAESDDEEDNHVDVKDDSQDNERNVKQMRPHVDLHGDEVFAFGSNKNLSLGLGDEDDRQFPERIQLDRPEQLLRRLYEDYKTQRYSNSGLEDLSSSVFSLHEPDVLPAVIRYKAYKIQDVVMAKLHTAILTDDPISNLHICGFGAGGRLGTGDETTRFDYVCIQGGGLASRRVSSIALGQDHCVAICTSGEVFTWGSNKHGQLGYVLPEVSTKETPMQLTPRQLYGLVKKETIIGAAASSIHSVIYTASGLYTFGRNEGQLGLMDADARSLKIQDVPRRVGVSLLQSPIKSVSVIDRATTVLLENRDVIVFTHYGFTRVLFPLEESNIYLSQALPTRYSKEANMICKITGGGNTIGALSSFGQVFTVDVPKPLESVPSSVSTTNPNKARNALPIPSRVWTLKKSHMSAVDVAIGQDGSIILCTAAGAIWRKEKRANIKSVHTKGSDSARPKDFKFVRVPHLTRAIAIRSNAFGAFAAVNKDCDVTREQIFVDSPRLIDNLFPLLSFYDYGGPKSRGEDEVAAEPELRFWLPAKKAPSTTLIKAAILKNKSAEDDFVHLAQRFEPLSETQYDIWITSNVTDVRIPVHSVLLKARSKVLRSCLATFHETYYFSIPEVMSIEYGQSGEIELKFLGADFLTLVNFVLYIYTETLVDVWHQTSKALHLAPRYRQVRIEVMKIASHLDLRRLERAVRVMVDPAPSLTEDFELAYMDMDLYSDADVMIDLAAGDERPAHSLILSARCPFFEGLFHGRAAGMWISSRKNTSEGGPEPTRVDLKHVEAEIFDLVLRHVYADTGDELFDHIVSKDLDGFIDTVIDVMSVANELMLDRLTQVCQRVIGRYVTPRNVCGLLNAVAESSIDEFKNTALEYVCLNLEGMLEQRLLADLDQYLIEELDEVVQENQLAYMPFVRAERAQHELFERHPDLPEQLERSRQRRIDSMRLQTRFIEDDIRPTPKARIGSYDKLSSSPINLRKMSQRASEDVSPYHSPAITPSDINDDMPFDMDEDAVSKPLGVSRADVSPSMLPVGNVPIMGLGDTKLEAQDGSTHRGESVTNSPATEINIPPSESRSTRFELPRAAWSQSVHQDRKTDLKQIMEQASVSRISNLTEAMKTVGPSRAQPHKVSQKERKKQQQQQQQQTKAQLDVSASPSESTSTPQSPWTQRTPTKPLSNSMLPEPAIVSSSSRPPLQRPAPTPRQNALAPSRTESEDQTRQKRSVSTPVKEQAASSPALQIKSIRHTPLPTRSTSFLDAHTSMADILAQQMGEKTAIKEAVTKRSLQEIQQEQEFQEWWDQESRRVQEETARTSVPSTGRSEKTSRGKGSRRRGSHRGAASLGPKNQETISQGPQDQAHTINESQSTRGDSERRGRGHGRGRGRGKPRHGQETVAST